jgi:epoxyqueuosine reductase
MSKKIFVHSCCTACASHVFRQLNKAGFKITAFFYNPQIEDESEYQKRKIDLIEYCQEKGIDFVEDKYDPTDFHCQIEPFKNQSSLKYISDKERYRRKRCTLCNTMLVQKTIEMARKKRIKHFTTTLLCSPYKNHDEIIEISNEKALDYGINFYYQDFRKGYWMGRNYARSHHIYTPSYCGCLDSKKERRLE